MFKKLAVAISVVMIFSGCKASLYDLPEGASKTVTNWKIYENEELSLRFKYPDYYGDPELKLVDGLEGDAFYLRFLFEHEPDDPYLVYFAGADENYLPHNNFERNFYRGNYNQQELCENKSQILAFIQFAGEKCTQISFNNGENLGVLYNAAFLDATSNSVEAVMVGNYPDEYSYAGLHAGFKVPYGYLHSRVKQGEKGVERFLTEMDKNDLPEELVEEIEVFRLVSESIEFLTQ